jgi:hypothetical protein
MSQKFHFSDILSSHEEVIFELYEGFESQRRDVPIEFF